VRMQCCSVGTEKLFTELLPNDGNESVTATAISSEVSALSSHSLAGGRSLSQVLPVLKKLRTLHQDARVKASTNGFDPYDPNYPRSFSQTALSHQQIYGLATNQIETYCLSSPSLSPSL
jgi:hypothetical protein